ncbi:phosphohistidine phosphatase SixA [Oscillatoria sp. FACHB-1406]|uniref:phosphohistidine phosphatase SixA n=1 Tax=Oscillatoria sp. FACHB-1406 TaxID=2692846 RepID=UPI001681F668|nr:phosphohistidine phosphatase SixA [Oscillatoria sp. FACHB-1406]MBD2578399.1 phosphohistidine phosphatase SixA [Oscillatoria sp. FACHB-1406]
MRELYLIRHGIAAERGTYADDDQRPLINLGRKKTKKVAKRLTALGLRCDRIVTSPLPRARETAVILRKAGLSPHLEEFPALAPDTDPQIGLKWLAEQSDTRLALVGHQPDLGNWAELLLWGEIREKLVLKKSGVIGLKLPESSSLVGQSELFWLTSPKWLL